MLTAVGDSMACSGAAPGPQKGGKTWFSGFSSKGVPRECMVLLYKLYAFTVRSYQSYQERIRMRIAVVTREFRMVPCTKDPFL